MSVQRRPKTGKPKKGRVKWIVRYRDPTGRERSETFDTEREAKERDAELRKSISRGSWLNPDHERLTVKDIFTDWMHSAARSESTMALYDNTARLQLGWLGDYPAARVTGADVAAWHRDLITDRHWLGDKGTPLSAGTARDQVRRLRSAYLWAVEQQLVARSPVVVPPASDDAEEVVQREEIPTLEEITTVVALVRAGGAKYTEVKRRGEKPREYTMRPHPVAADMMVTAMLTGMRVNEICGLIPSDIDWDAGVIRLTMQMNVRTRKRGRLKSKASKRQIPIAPELAPILRRYADGKGPGEWLFSGAQGQSVRSSRLAVYVDRARRHAGIERVTFHSLRHFFASALITAGRPIHEVSEVLGHRSPSTTLDVYTHVLDRDGAGMRDAISSAIGCGIDAGSRHLRAVP